ncbi:MAG: hypothetical protein AAF639_31705 [Chloroflexota bacterium]
MNRPALLPLIGQTNIENPDEIIPQVYKAIKSVHSEEMKQRLLFELLALLRDEELIKMVETLIRQDEWALDTPFIRRLREEGRTEEREIWKAISETWNAERAELYLEREMNELRMANLIKTQQAEREARRQGMLKFMASRYDPSVSEYLRVQELLSTIDSNEKLEAITNAIMRFSDFGQFYLMVEEAAKAEQNADTGEL